MKKIAVILLIFVLSIDSVSIYAQIKTVIEVKDVNIHVKFQQSPAAAWDLGIYPDATSFMETNEVNNEGWIGPLMATGTRKIRIGTNYLEIRVAGTWEVVAYTDNFGLYGYPTDPNFIGWEYWPRERNMAYIESFSGLHSQDNDIDGMPDLHLPIKVRSEGICGIEDINNEGIPYPIGSEISDRDWQGDTAQFSYVGEKAMETLLGYPLTRIARIGLTDLNNMERIQIRYAIHEGWAGKEIYTGIIYYELRGN